MAVLEPLPKSNLLRSGIQQGLIDTFSTKPATYQYYNTHYHVYNKNIWMPYNMHAMMKNVGETTNHLYHQAAGDM